MRDTRDIHKGGRPPLNRPDSFYKGILADYEVMTTRQMAEKHGVCRQTIFKWLKAAREKFPVSTP